MAARRDDRVRRPRPDRRADLPGLCDRVCALLDAEGAEIALCDVRGVEPDAVTVDALARLQLAVRAAAAEVQLAARSPRRSTCDARADDVLPRRRRATVRRAADVRPRRGYASSRGGRPKSGNSVSVSRKNVISTIRPSDDLEHLQRPRLVAAVRRLGLYWPNAGEPLARHRRDRRASRGSRCPGRTTT